jgi:hypothetical protein
MEVRGQTLPELYDWVARTRYFASVWQSAGQAEATSPAAWGELLVSELVASGAARRVGERIEPA